MSILNLIESRHSYRGKYKNTPVPREDLVKIMEAGLVAPSGCNKQTTSLIAVDDPEVLGRLRHVITPPVGETAPAAICVLTQRINAYRDKCFAVQDYSAAIQNMLLAIVDLGYQSCWYEGHITDDDRICDQMAQILHVPGDYELVCFLPVGVAENAPILPEKKTFEERAWFNSFNKEIVVMLKNLIIRREKPEDYIKTELMTMRSFWNKYWPGCTEHFLIRIIRESKDYVSKISRIAELDGKIVGAVYYTKAWIVDGDIKHEIVTFGPLAVEPTLEGNDIGGALMRETIRLAKDSGFAGIALMGEPNYYPRFGFERGAKYGITDAKGNTCDELMCLPLNSDFGKIKGKFIESEDFEKLEDEKRLEEINKEFPAYRKVKVQEGFMQIFEQHLGVIESVEDDTYMVRYWELLISAKADDTLKEKPEKGDDVQFAWNHKGVSRITKVIKNLLDGQLPVSRGEQNVRTDSDKTEYITP